MTPTLQKSGTRIVWMAALGMVALLGNGTPARAHEDPAGCFETGPAIVVSVFRANGTTGVVGSISECETINYRARLQKAANIDDICAFSGGTFRLTTPDGTVHDISLNVPCIGGSGGEGCDPTVTVFQSALIPYTVSVGDIVGGFVTARAQYTGGIAHDSPGNTAGVSAFSPRSTSVVRCPDNDPCTIDVCDPNARGAAACSSTPIVCDDNSTCTTDQCVGGECVFTAVGCGDNNACTIDSCDPVTGCRNTPIVCTDNDPCTADSCDPATGCVFTPGAVTCNDNDPCTSDACVAGVGCVFTPGALDCNDNDVCTTDACVAGVGCVFTPGALNCNDNDVCTDDVCHPVNGCVFTPNPNNDPSCQDCLCLLVCDEEFIDNDMQSVEQAADACGPTPDVLVNDDRPTEVGNPPLVWNTDCAPDTTRLPTGQVDEEGCFMLPLEGATIDYADSTFNATCPRNTADWVAMYVAGQIPQRCLDKVRNVMPIRNQDWAKLVGQSCVVVQYDSDISENYKPIYANLQGARYGLFFMTIDGIVLPGTLPESGSSTTLYDLDITVDPAQDLGEFDVCLDTFDIRVRDHEPDSCQLTRARCSGGILEVRATNDFRNKTVNGSQTLMTVSIDGFVLEAPMTFSSNRWNYTAPCPGNNLVGRRISVQTNAGCAYNGTIAVQ